MRITQNNLTQLASNMNKLPPEIKAQLGKVISGQIISIQSDKVATLVSGSTELTVQISGVKLAENQVVHLQITGYEEGAFTAKLLPETTNSDQKSPMNMGLIFDKLGLPHTEENKQVLDAMIKANLPIDSDTFSRMRQGMLEVKIVAGELKQPDAPQLLRTDLDVPMKALAIKLIQTSQDQMPIKEAPIFSDKQSNLRYNPEVEQQITLSNDRQAPMTQNALPTQNTLPTQNALPAQNALPTQAPLDLERLLGQIILSSENIPAAKEPILNLFNQFSHFDESMLIKHDLPLTIKNMFLSSMGAFQSEKNVERFIRVLNQLDHTVLSDALKQTLAEVLSSQSDPVEKLKQLLDVIRSSQLPLKEKVSLENDLSILKESAQLSKPTIDQMMYLPIPVIIHKEPEIAHLFMKKGKQKFNPEDLTLLVALNTHHHGEVRVLIHKKNAHVDLNFSFETEGAKQLFEGFQDQLTSALTRFTSYNFKVSFTVKHESTNSTFEDSEVSTFGFDIKV